MKMKIKAKIIVTTMMIVVVVALLPMSASLAEDADGDGTNDDMTGYTSFEVSSSGLSGYNVLVTPGGYNGITATRIRNLGASVTEATPSTLTSEMLAQYDVVWISLGGADSVDDAGKADIIKSYVYNGGGLIVEQPHDIGSPQCLPYGFEIVDFNYENPCTGTILVTDHYLTQGLTIENNEIPPAYDEVGTIGPEWTVLAIDGDATDPDPKLSVADYGAGRIIVELGATNVATPSCMCGVCMKDVTIERMINWVAASSGEESLKVEIVGPSSIVLCNPIHVNKKLDAKLETVAEPKGGKYEWTVLEGEDKIRLWVKNTKSKSVTAWGIAPSETREDVLIRVTYKLGSQTCSDEHHMTILKPTLLELVEDYPQYYVARNKKTGQIIDYVTHYRFGVCDQFKPPKRINVEGMYVFEFAIFHSGNYDPGDIELGSGPTDSNGEFDDYLKPPTAKLFGHHLPIPTDLLIKVRQFIFVEGWEVGTRCLTYYYDHATSYEGNCWP